MDVQSMERIKKGLVSIARQGLRDGTDGMTVFTFREDDPDWRR